MTSFAFVMGVLPMARATGAGAYSRNSLGIVIALGIAVSSVLGRFVIPIYTRCGQVWHKLEAAAHRHKLLTGSDLGTAWWTRHADYHPPLPRWFNSLDYLTTAASAFWHAT
jgi:hypothetical protein